MPGSDESTVPKFSSFKPRGNTNAPPSQTSGNTRHDGRRREVKLGNHRVEKSKSHRDRHHDTSLPLRQSDHYRPGATQHDARKHGYHNSQDRRLDRRREERDCTTNHEQSNQHAQPRDELPSQRFADIFVIDTKGDEANLKYCRPNKWAVPLYHLYGSCSIVGHDPDIKIDRWLSDEHGYTLRYPKEKRPTKRFEPIEPEEIFGVSAADAIDGEDFHESQAHESSEDGAEAVEMDFVALHEQEQEQDEG